MKSTVRDLKKRNRKAVNNIKKFNPANHTIYNKGYRNLFFEGLFISALIAEPVRMCMEEAV